MDHKLMFCWDCFCKI